MRTQKLHRSSFSSDTRNADGPVRNAQRWPENIEYKRDRGCGRQKFERNLCYFIRHLNIIVAILRRNIVLRGIEIK